GSAGGCGRMGPPWGGARSCQHNEHRGHDAQPKAPMSAHEAPASGNAFGAEPDRGDGGQGHSGHLLGFGSRPPPSWTQGTVVRFDSVRTASVTSATDRITGPGGHPFVLPAIVPFSLDRPRTLASGCRV